MRQCIDASVRRPGRPRLPGPALLGRAPIQRPFGRKQPGSRPTPKAPAWRCRRSFQQTLSAASVPRRQSNFAYKRAVLLMLQLVGLSPISCGKLPGPGPAEGRGGGGGGGGGTAARPSTAAGASATATRGRADGGGAAVNIGADANAAAPP